MRAFTKFLVGGAGLAALAAAAPAAAQYYPQYPGGGYPSGGYGYPGGGYGQGGVLGSILDSILGGRSYATNDRYAVEQCVRAVEHRINTRGFDNERGRYPQYGYGYGYNNRYPSGYMGARVLGVTQVQRRSNGGLKVIGVATSGAPAGYGYPGGPYGGGYGSYGYNASVADARFDCTIDRFGRITDIDANRNQAGYNPYRRY